jgi:alpha-amylase
MCTKWFSDGDVHKYFNPYDTPYEAFIAYNNVLHDLRLRITESLKGKKTAKKTAAKKTALPEIVVKTPVIKKKAAAKKTVKKK